MSDLDPGTDRQLKSALHSAKRKPPEITSPGAFRIVGIGYIRRSNDAPLEISPRKRDQDVAAVRHCQKGASRQLTTFTIGPPRASESQCFARLHVPNDLVNLSAIQRALDPHHSR